jgi:hypothetical protein
MNAYFFNVTNEERSTILDQHKYAYDGLQTMQSQMKNPMDLYVQDFANDKEGITINSKGDVKKYTNTKIHEQLDLPYTSTPDLYSEMNEGEEMCEQCGSGTMVEGECNECGYKQVKGIGGASDFDYVGEEQQLDELGTDELVKGKKYNFDFPSFDDEVEFDDEFEDKFGGNKMYKFKGKKHGSHLVPGKHIEDYMSDIEDEEIKESVTLERNTIMEMFQRMNVI